MPRPGTIPASVREYLTFQSMPWLGDALAGGLVRGGTYLLSGEPGIGKSTLAVQILGDLARQGVKTLYLATEQGQDDVEATLVRLFARGERLPRSITDHFHMDDSLPDIEGLPAFFESHIDPPGREYAGTEVIVLDSIQGRGLPSSSTRKYRALYEFSRRAKAAGVATILLSHVTKDGRIAGPKALEHNVDTVLHLRRFHRVRPLFVSKTRFGAEPNDPIPLVFDKGGRLGVSLLASARSATTLGYPGMGHNLAEAQASITLPEIGSRPQKNHPGIPRAKMTQLIRLLGELDDVGLSELSFEVNCYLPGNRRYVNDLDLPLAVALVSSLTRQLVPPKSMFLGELDLGMRIRPYNACWMCELAKLLLGGCDRVERVYLSEESAAEFAGLSYHGRRKVGDVVAVHGVRDLVTMVRALWPSLFEK